MAPRRTASNDSQNAATPSLQEIIFSCSICYTLPSDVYATKETNKGFHSSSGDESGIVTKFWIAECSHVFCGRHLQNGAPPFHPEGQRPRAPCPVCVLHDPHNDQPKELFGIRGLEPGEYDQSIPEEYFHCPPMRLNTNAEDADLDALKFQYSHISGYAVQVTKLWKADRRRRRALEQSMTKERQLWEKKQSEFNARMADLEKSEAKLKKWEQRKGMINHYLGMVAKMGDDIKSMRAQLIGLGFDVPERSYSFKDQTDGGQPQSTTRHVEVRHRQSSTTLVGDKHRTSSSTLKRRHPSDHYEDDQEDRPPLRTNNSLMPPPLPLQRQHPVSRVPQDQPPNGQSLPSNQSDLRPPVLTQMHVQTSRNNQFDTGLRPPDPPRADANSYRQTPTIYARAPVPDQQRIWHDNQTQVQASIGSPSYYETQQAVSLPFRSSRDAPVSGYQYDPGRLEATPVYSERGTYLSKPAQRRTIRHSDLNDHTRYDSMPGGKLARGPPSSRVQHFDPSYGALVQPSGEHAPPPMRSVNAPFSQPSQAAPDSVTSRSIATPAQRRFGAAGESVVSPFFKPSQRPDTNQRPPARGSELRNLPASPARGEYRMQPPSMPAYDRRDEQFSRGDLPASSRGYTGPTPYRQPGQQSDQYSQYCNRSIATFGSQAMAPPSSTNRNRMTLPPSSSRMTYRNMQDPELSRINGVRGGGVPFPANVGRQNLASAAQRSGLYSAAGTRRSVLR